MSEANASPASPSTSADSGTGVSVGPSSLEERSAAAFGLTEPAGEASTTPVTSDGVSPVGSVEPDAIAKARQDRRAALDKLKSEERGRVDAMKAIRERDELRQRLAAAEAKEKEYSGRIDPKSLTKEQFFALASQNPGLTPHELGEWMRDQMANPELAAARAASSIVDPKVSALEKKLADQQAMIDQFMQSQSAAKEHAQERQAAEQFFAFTRENAQTSPYSARFLEKHGANEFYKLAQSAVQDVPAQAGAQAVLDEIEERLAQLGSIYLPETGTPQRRQASPNPNTHAAAQAPTHVTNSLAQQRSSVVNEDENWASLPFEERSARVFG